MRKILNLYFIMLSCSVDFKDQEWVVGRKPASANGRVYIFNKMVELVVAINFVKSALQLKSTERSCRSSLSGFELSCVLGFGRVKPPIAVGPRESTQRNFFKSPLIAMTSKQTPSGNK